MHTFITSRSRREVFLNNIESNMDRSVFLHGNGRWANKRNDLPEASSMHETRQEAVEAATMMLQSQGGGELVIFGKDGKITRFGTISALNESEFA